MPPQEQIFTEELHDNMIVTVTPSGSYSFLIVLFICRIATELKCLYPPVLNV